MEMRLTSVHRAAGDQVEVAWSGFKVRVRVRVRIRVKVRVRVRLRVRVRVRVRWSRLPWLVSCSAARNMRQTS